jgi:hypothetical protein
MTSILSIAGIRALAYCKGCRFDRIDVPAKWRLHAGNGALSSRPLAFREAYLLLMGMPNVQV